MALESIEVVPYNHVWPALFSEEADHIKYALGSICIDIHHIGSTSVPSLAAKPIIDIMPVVIDITQVDKYTSQITALGYEAKGEYGILFRLFFHKGKDVRTHNIHIFERGNSEIERHLKFRDWMRYHPYDRDLYADLKKRLAEQFPHDMMSYCLGKEDFIAAIDAKAGWEGVRVVKALTSKEWDACQRIYAEQGHFFAQSSVNNATHFYFALFKGQAIVTVAHIELLCNSLATLRFLATDQKNDAQEYNKTMKILLEKWIKYQGKTLIVSKDLR